MAYRQLNEKRILINGCMINYVSAGSGIPMIFLHNGGGFWQSWEKQIRYFSYKYHTVGIDWPGFGNSDMPEKPLTRSLLSATLKGFMDEMRFENAIIIGNCIGASAAEEFARANPKRTRGLVLFNIFPGDKIIPWSVFKPLVKYFNGNRVLRKKFSGALRSVFLRAPVRRVFPDILFSDSFSRKDRLFIKYLKKYKIAKQTRSGNEMQFWSHSFRRRKTLPGHKLMPHLLVWGAQNKVLPAKRFLNESRKRLGSAQVVTIKNSGHLCMYERPEEVNKVLEAYFDGQSRLAES